MTKLELVKQFKAFYETQYGFYGMCSCISNAYHHHKISIEELVLLRTILIEQAKKENIYEKKEYWWPSDTGKKPRIEFLERLIDNLSEST